MAGARKKAAEPEEVIVTCSVNNIWTTRGKITRGKSIMLTASEAKMIEDAMDARNKGE